MRYRKKLSNEEQALLDNTLRMAAIRMGLQRKQKMPKEIKRMIIGRAIGEIEERRKTNSSDLTRNPTSHETQDNSFSWIESVCLGGTR